MASEIRVNQIQNRSGLTTTTLTDTGVTISGILTVSENLNVGGVLTYEDVTNIDSVGVITARDGLRVTGIATATAFHGDGSQLTGITTAFGNSSVNTSGIITATSFVPTTGQLSHRNIIINGACNIAQRGVSATSVSGQYKTVDRFSVNYSGEDEDPTEAQHTLSTSDTPYTLGFRKSFHITNGNQTSGAGAADYVQPQYKIEAQDIANSGWNYTDSNSFITLSFWVKASVAGDYTLNMNTHDGTPYRYLMEYSLLANTWKHVVFKIPGNSNLTVNNDNGLGLQIMWYPFLGSNYIQADQENNWYASSNGKYGTVSTTNWWTTNDATWEITGVQLEVGPVVTPFEHRSFADELKRCQRYYYATSRWMGGSRGSSTSRSFVTDFGMRLTGSQVSGGTYTNTATSGGDVVYVGSSATRQASDVNANSLGASSTSSNGSLQLGVTVGYGLGSGDNGIVTGLYISGFTIDHEL